jgi:hypothetical protein
MAGLGKYRRLVATSTLDNSGLLMEVVIPLKPLVDHELGRLPLK